MLKQLLTGGSLLALLLAGGLSAQAKTQEAMLQSQAQQAPTTSPGPDGSITAPEGITAPDGTTTPEGTMSPDGTTTPEGTMAPDSMTTSKTCEFITPTSPTGGGSRARLQAGCTNP